MKKIPTLFVREFLNQHDFILTEKVTPGMEWVLKGEGVATIKIDGSATAIIEGVFYKRYDAKRGKTPPMSAIPCCEPDPITGHWPHWIKVDPLAKGDQWLYAAYINAGGNALRDGTYEAIGPHFQGNPYGLEKDTLERHGIRIVNPERSYEGLRDFLKENYVEGIVFWKDDQPQCKIKRRDYGFPWNNANQQGKVSPK